MKKSYKEHSRTNWSSKDDDWPGIERVNFGCLQRIADAAEAMAQNHLRLQSDLEYYKNRCKRLENDNQHLRNSRAAHKAAYTKLKNKLTSEEESYAV